MTGFLEKLSHFVVATAEQKSPILCVKDFLPSSVMTFQLDSMLEVGSLSIVKWILIRNSGPFRLILHRLESFSLELISGVLEFDILRSWDLFGESLLDINAFQPTVWTTVQPLWISNHVAKFFARTPSALGVLAKSVCTAESATKLARIPLAMRHQGPNCALASVDPTQTPQEATVTRVLASPKYIGGSVVASCSSPYLGIPANHLSVVWLPPHQKHLVDSVPSPVDYCSNGETFARSTNIDLVVPACSAMAGWVKRSVFTFFKKLIEQMQIGIHVAWGG